MRVDAGSYYDTLPGLAHQCGDIWRNLPSFGLLGPKHCSGIVITPACDLSWQKSDTLTYLPIIPIRSYFATDAALPVVVDRVATALQVSGCAPSPQWSAQSYVSPDETELSALESTVEQFRASKQHPARILTALDRVIAGTTVLRLINNQAIDPIDTDVLMNLFGSEWAKIKEKIITNSYSSALHFLPFDTQDNVFSGVPAHSVALFRYPVTIPLKILNHAQETFDSTWSDKVATFSTPDSLKTAVSPEQPIKLLSLKASFLSDLLTRFAALYNRIGSPDFTKHTVNMYSSEVDT